MSSVLAGGILDGIGRVFQPIAEVIEHLTISGDQKVALQQKLLEGQFAASAQVMDYERQLLDARSKIILAEAQGGSWMQRNWRPVTMLTFVALIVLRMFDLTSHHITEEEYLLLWSLVKIGLGGYVAGRSVEKTASVLAPALAAMQQKGARGSVG